MSAFLPLAGGPAPGGARSGPDPLRPGAAKASGAERGEGGREPASPVAENPFVHLLLALAGGGADVHSGAREGEGDEGSLEGGGSDAEGAGGGAGASPGVGTETLVSLRAPLVPAGGAPVAAAEASHQTEEATGPNAASDPTSSPTSARHPSEAPALRHTEGVHPELVQRVERVVERMWVEHGHRVEVVEGHRTQARQDRLYAQGRSTPGAVVTWTRDSAHTRGHAMDVIINGGWDDLDAFRTLQEVAGTEGIRTLGMRDPGHLELPRGAAGQGGHSHGPAHAHAHAAGGGRDGGASRAGVSLPPLSELRPVDLEAPVAGNSGFRGVARVARVARVAAVARPGNHGPSAPENRASPASSAGGVSGIRGGGGIGFGSIGGFAGGGLPGGILPGALGTLGGLPVTAEGKGPGAMGSVGIEAIPELLPRALSGFPNPVLGVTPVGIPGTHGAAAPGSGVGGDAGKGGEGTGGGGSNGEGSSGPSTLGETEGETSTRSPTEGLRTLSSGERDRLLERLLQGRTRGQGGVPGLTGAGGILPQAGGGGLPVGGAAAPGAVGASTLFRAEQVRALQAAAGPSGNLSVSLDNVDGAGTDLRLGMRGSSVSAEIAATDPLQARALRLRLGELRTSLAERGLEPDRLGVRWSGVESAPTREGERGMTSGGDGDAGGSKDDGRSEGDARQRGKAPDRDEPGTGDFARHFREDAR